MVRAPLKVFLTMLWSAIKEAEFPKTGKDWSLFWSILKKELIPREEISKLRDEFSKAKPEQKRFMKIRYGVIAGYIIGFVAVFGWCLYYNMSWVMTQVYVLMYAGAWLGVLSIYWNIRNWLTKRKRKPDS